MRYTKAYSNGFITLDASQFPPIVQEVLDIEIKNSPPFMAAVKELKKYEDAAESSPLSAVPQNLIDFYQENISRNFITPHELDNIKFWLDKVDADVILWAMKQAVEYKKPSWKYIEGILKNNYNVGRTTLAAVQDAQRTYKAQKDAPSSVFDDSGFNYDEVEKLMQKKG